MPRAAVVCIALSVMVGCGTGSTPPEAVRQVDQPFSNFPEANHAFITAEALRFLRSDVIDRVMHANVLVDAHVFDERRHFDACTFKGSMNQINHRFEEAVTALDPTALDSVHAQREFGRLLHTVQDFYSHSNWVEIQQVIPSLDMVDTGLDFWSAFETRYGSVSSDFVLSVQGNPPRSRPALQRSPAGTPWPSGNLVTFGTSGIFGLVTGVPVTTPPDQSECPATATYTHAELNKDSSDREGFADAVALAVEQTAHEWCRLVSLVRKTTYGVAGDRFLYDNWVDSVPAAVCGDEADLEAAPDTIPPSATALAPSETRTYQFKLLNNGSGTAYGATWKAVFSGAVGSIDGAVVRTGISTVACSSLGLAVECSLPDALPAAETATIELTMHAGGVGTILASVQVSSHNPDPIANNNTASIEFDVSSNCQVSRRLLVADPGLVGSLLGMALQPDGSVLVSYFDHGTPPSSQPVQVVFLDESGAIVQLGSAGYQNGIRPAPVFDVGSDGRLGMPVTVLPDDAGGSLSMTYFGPVGSDPILRVADPVDTGLTQGDHGFGFSPEDIPEISYMRTRPSIITPGLFDVELQLARWDASSAAWTTQLVDSGTWVAPTASHAMDVDVHGDAHMTYVAWPLIPDGQGGWTTDVMRFMYARVTPSGATTLVQVDSAPADGHEIAGYLSAVRADAIGRAHVAYVNVRAMDELWYSGPQGNAGLESVAGTIWAAAVAVAGTGDPIVAFVAEAATPQRSGLFVWAKSADGQWVRSLDFRDPAATRSVAAIVDGTGSLRVTYVTADGLWLASEPASCLQ